MPVIQIPFDSVPTNVSISRRTGTAPIARDTAADNTHQAAPPATECETSTAAVQTLAAMNAQLTLLDQTLKDELASIGAHLVAAATQIAKEALGSDNALVEERVAHFADVLLRKIPSDRSAVFYVHPSCVATLSDWMSRQQDAAMTIQPDATVEPGDCRIESDDKGFLASLDSFLHAAAKRTSLHRGEQ